MSDEGYVEQRSISGALLGVVAVALLAALGGLAWSYGLQNHLSAAEQKITAAEQKNAELSQQLDATNANPANGVVYVVHKFLGQGERAQTRNVN